jgi:hypothetical protein
MDKPIFLNHITQGSQEWLDIRKTRVTSTLASVILGVNPYPQLAIAPIKLIMTLGNVGEQLAVAEYMAKYYQEGPFCHTGIVLEAPARGSDFASSPDLLCGAKGCVEVKTRAYKFRDEIPPHEMCQMQFNMAICQREWTDHVQYMFGKPIRVKRVLYNRDWFMENQSILRNYLKK